MVSHIAGLKGDARGNQPLHTKRPLLDIGIVEIRAHARLVARARILATRDKAQVSRLYPRAGGICGNADVVDRSRVDYWRRRSHVQKDIVVRGVIRHAIAAADDCLILSDQLLQDARRPGKAKVRPVVIEVFRNVRDFRDVGGQTGGPETFGHVLNSDVMQEIDRLLVPFPAQAEVECEVALYPPVVLPVESQVVLFEIEIERAIRQRELAAGGRVSGAGARAARSPLEEVAKGVAWCGSSRRVHAIRSRTGAAEKAETTIDAGEEMVRRALMIEFSAELESVPPARPRRVALVLRVVDLAVLRQVRRQTEGGVRVRCVRESNVRRARRHVLDSALRETLTAGKLKEARAVADASLRYEVARPGARIVPTVLPVLCRHGHKCSTGDGGGTAVQCSVAVLIDEPEEEAVFVAYCPIAAAGDLLVVKIVPHDTVYKCERHRCRCRAVGDRDVLHNAGGLRIAGRNPVRPELLDRGHSRVVGERRSQSSKAGRRRGEA